MKLISAYGRQHRQLVAHIDETRAILGESQHSRRLSTTHSADAGISSSVIGSTFFRHGMIKAYCAADVPSSKSDVPCGSFGCQYGPKGRAAVKDAPRGMSIDCGSNNVRTGQTEIRE